MMKRKKLTQKSYKSILYKYLNPSIPYGKFKYNNIIYSIGDILLIKSNSKVEERIHYSIAKLIRIIPSNGIPTTPKWPTIEIEWYYLKNEVVRTEFNGLINEQYYNSLSDDEVFYSCHRDVIFIESVVNHANVVSMEEYIINKTSTNLFFTRASYDHYNGEIKPDIRQWEKYCYCKMPFNPNLLYVKCDKCNEWFHLQCVGLSEDEVSEEKEFYCKKCNLCP